MAGKLQIIKFRNADCGLRILNVGRFDLSIRNLYPVESSEGGPPPAAFHGASLKSTIDLLQNAYKGCT
jgi:hypothetical protein